MKHCVDCEFQKSDVVQTPGGMARMYVCTHSECSDPVSAEAIPCAMARREQVFCGFNAKYFKKKEEPVKAPVVQLVSSS